MNEDFRFSILPVPEGKALTFQEIEQHFLKQLADALPKCVQSLQNLADMYARAGRHDEARALVEKLITLTDDPEQHARCYLLMGGLMEKIRDYEGAVKFYRQAFGMEPCATSTWFFIHNNLGFSLNQLARHDEAVPFLRRAIEIDPGRPNGYKNLGLAFAALGRYAEAAELFISATRVEAADPRSLRHLEELVAAHPELEVDIPNLRKRLEACRSAVEIARASQPDLPSLWKADRERQRRKKPKRKRKG